MIGGGGIVVLPRPSGHTSTSERSGHVQVRVGGGRRHLETVHFQVIGVWPELQLLGHAPLGMYLSKPLCTVFYFSGYIPKVYLTARSRSRIHNPEARESACPNRERTHLPAQLSPRRSLSACWPWRSEEHTSELQSLRHLVCRLLLEKK